jgi:hypothetical protein
MKEDGEPTVGDASHVEISGDEGISSKAIRYFPNFRSDGKRIPYIVHGPQPAERVVRRVTRKGAARAASGPALAGVFSR